MKRTCAGFSLQSFNSHLQLREGFHEEHVPIRRIRRYLLQLFPIDIISNTDGENSNTLVLEFHGALFDALVTAQRAFTVR